jgi:hypothetical protein
VEAGEPACLLLSPDGSEGTALSGALGFAFSGGFSSKVFGVAQLNLAPKQNPRFSSLSVYNYPFLKRSILYKYIDIMVLNSLEPIPLSRI